MGVRGQYEHLNSPAATEEEVLDYLREHSAYVVEAGGAATPLDEFWREGDLERYRQAARVWSKDAPPRFALPDLTTCLSVVAGPAGLPQTTFIEYLTMLWNGYCAWMAGEGRDPAHPEESGRQRAARRARESMALSRERRRGSDDPERAELLALDKRLYDEYMAACRRRREEVARLDQDVRDAKAAYDQIHAQVKAGQ